MIPLGSAPILIGRSPTCTLVIDDDYCSAKHCRIFPEGDQWRVEDLGSTNGTYLDNQRVGDPMPFKRGDHLRLGATTLEPRSLSVFLSLHFAARSDVGLVRANNQDSAFAGPHLLVVADGMGGAAGGDIASSIAVGRLAALDGESHGPDEALDELKDAIAQAHAEIVQRAANDPELSGLGTTVTALLRAGSTLSMAHIGDSRAYLLRDGALDQVTTDHNFVQHLVDTGRLSAADAENHPKRSMLLRVLGDVDADVPVDISVRETRPGDRWMLCSDGLSGVVSRDTIAQTLADVSDPGDCADALVGLALAAGAPDNVTCIVADVVDIDAQADGIGPSSTSQIVGAAATDRHRPTAGGSSAAGRAARLQQQSARVEDDDDDARRLRHLGKGQAMGAATDRAAGGRWRRVGRVPLDPDAVLRGLRRYRCRHLPGNSAGSAVHSVGDVDRGHGHPRRHPRAVPAATHRGHDPCGQPRGGARDRGVPHGRHPRADARADAGAHVQPVRERLHGGPQPRGVRLREGRLGGDRRRGHGPLGPHARAWLCWAWRG
nr:FHA domain-containing protein [Demequina litorisediminis]